jgi:hypothetical protein
MRELTLEEATAIARVCHEANRAYCKTLGDDSQPTWDEAPSWQCISAVQGVLVAATHPGAQPSDSHESWLAEKRAAGWKYGPVKDPDKREHPCFVPYEQLPVAQRRKDSLCLAVARALDPRSAGLACEAELRARIAELEQLLGPRPAGAVREEVDALARLMSAKLDGHNHDRGQYGWRSANPEQLLAWFDRYVVELRNEVRLEAGPEAIGGKAANVANLAMMIADVAGALGPRPALGKAVA